MTVHLDPEAAASSPDRPPTNRWVGVGQIVLLDAVGPFLAYQFLHSRGVGEVWSLILSGTLPAIGVLIDLIRFRKLDVIGALVLAGIAVGAFLALLTDNPRAVLLEGAVGTGVFAVACLWSLRGRRPLMFRFALASMGGPTSARGRHFDELYESFGGFRQYFRNITLGWGLAYLVEVAIKITVTQTESTGIAVAVSRFLAFPIAGVLVVWMVIYGKAMRRRGEALQAKQELRERAAATATATAAAAHAVTTS